MTILSRRMLLAGTALVLPAMALAQTPPAAPEMAAADDNVGDIVVTAQLRSERLRDIPIAVSAFDARDIESRNVTTLDQLQASVPGLRLVDIGPGSQRIQLRGIAQYQGLPTVGNYIDEFSINPFGASGVAEVRLLDLQRIEVLRGPQPALYGEGSMGGTIRYVTASPDLNDVSGSGLAEVNTVRGGDLGYKFEGILNAPLATDKAGLRIAAAHERAGGWIDGPLGNDRNGTDTTTIRAKLLLTPSEPFRIELLGQFHDAQQDVKSYSSGDRTTDQIVASVAKQRYYLGTLQLSYDAGPVTLLSASGYLRQTGRSVDDSARFYNQLFGAPLLLTAASDSRGTLKKWSQEFRLTSNSSGPLRYLAGVSYTDGKTSGFIDGDGESLVPGLPASALGVVFTQDAKTRSRILALYGSVSYDLLDRLTVDVGGRYFRDKRSLDSLFVLIGFPATPPVPPSSATFDSFNPRVSLTYKTGGSGIIYANAAKGFRSGGFNSVTAPEVPPTFDPETLWTYEIGTKQSVIGDTLLLEAAVYYNDYKDIQANQLVNPSVATVVNSGSASGFGVDVTARARPTRNLMFTGTLGYNNLRFDTNTIDRLKGDPADLVPDWTWSASLDYTPRLSDSVGLVAHADIGFTDQAQISIRSLTFTQTAFSEDRAVTNLRLGLTFDIGEAYVFASNVFDVNRIINPAFGAFFEPTYTRPRTIGIGLKGRF